MWPQRRLYLLITQSMSNSRRVGRGCGEGARRKQATEVTSDESREFAVDEVVWAKVVGHPWWPALVEEKSYPTYLLDPQDARLRRKEVTYRVAFFGEASHAFLEESKIAEFLPNRDYFIDMAAKHAKRTNLDTFRASVRQADILSNNPDEVPDLALSLTPRKERTANEERTAVRRRDNAEQKQVSTQKPIKITNNHQQKLISLPFPVTASQRQISKCALRHLRSKNNGKYTFRTLKCAIVNALRGQKLLKRSETMYSADALAWMRRILAMEIDEFVESYCKKGEIALAPAATPPKERTPSTAAPSSAPATYIFIDDLGNQSTLSEPLQPYDFYIRL